MRELGTGPIETGSSPSTRHSAAQAPSVHQLRWCGGRFSRLLGKAVSGEGWSGMATTSSPPGARQASIA